MEPDERFTPRVCALLAADVSGFSALIGEDDERTACAVQELQTLVQGVTADVGGRAQPRAGDAIVAIFDSVVAAVDAALRVQRQLAEQEVAGLRLKLRIGVHLGDVLIRDGAAFGDAVNVATRLQTLARPGTVCISEGVYQQVRNKFEETFVDLGYRQLGKASGPVRAYLIVPRESEAGRARPYRRRESTWIAVAAALVLLAVASIIVVQRHGWLRSEHRAATTLEPSATPVGTRGPASSAVEQKADRTEPPVDGRPVALGVMVFKALGTESGNAWMREALRDGLNTQLSEISNVKVYSKEFLDFLMTRQGLTEIEAANQLGITKMLTGSFLAVGGRLRIETHVVDVASGVLESSYTTEGPAQEFLDLQDKVVLGAIARLSLPITQEERTALLARRSTNVEALKLLLEAERGGSAKPTGAGSGPATGEPHSALHPGSVMVAWFAPCPALASDEDGDQVAILDVIERYRRATEAGHVDALAALYTDFTPEQRAAQQRYLDNVRNLVIAVENIDLAVVGDEAVVSFTRIDRFADVRTGRPMHVAVRLTKMLRRENDQWKLVRGE
jgi:adenylate cyclase